MKPIDETLESDDKLDEERRKSEKEEMERVDRNVKVEAEAEKGELML